MEKEKKEAIKKGWCVCLAIIGIISLIGTPSLASLAERSTTQTTTTGIGTIVERNTPQSDNIVPDNQGAPTSDDPWQVTLNFIESTHGKKDTTVFGENSAASDGKDSYDVPKPGLPPAPYIYAWFDAGLASPYDKLWEDYKHYPGTLDKVWNLSVICDTSGPRDSTDVTITWDKTKINTTEYTHIDLWKDDVKIANMLTVSTVTFTAVSGTTYDLQIKCHVNQAPTATDDVAATNEDVPVWVHVLVNDVDSDGTLDPTSVTVVGVPLHGTTSVNTTTGEIRFTPAANYYGAGRFNYTVNDDDGATSNAAIVNITVVQLHQINVKAHWNLISIPCYDTIAKTDVKVRISGTDHTWSQAVSDGHILDTLYGWSGTVYTIETSLIHGKGYWFYAYVDCQLLIYSNAVGTVHITDLQVKWNMIGLPYASSINTVDLHFEYLSGTHTWQQAIDDGYLLGFLYGWDRTNQMYSLETQLQPGYGYWMYAYQTCTMKQ